MANELREQQLDGNGQVERNLSRNKKLGARTATPQPPPEDPRLEELRKLAQTPKFRELFEYIGRSSPYRSVLTSIRNLDVWNDNAWTRAQGPLEYVIPGYMDSERYDRNVVKALFNTARDAYRSARSSYPRTVPDVIRARYDSRLADVLGRIDQTDRAFYQTFTEVVFEGGIFREIPRKTSPK